MTAQQQAKTGKHTNGTSANGQHIAQHHMTALARDSAISLEVIAERGYWTAVDATDLAALGFAGVQQIVPALMVPVYDVFGRRAFVLARPDAPRLDKTNRPIKYESPAGVGMVLDVPPRVRAMLADPQIPLLVTEGTKKADAAASVGLCCIALLGVWNWRGTNASGGKTALADWNAIALNDRRVGIVFDSDAESKPQVRRATVAFGQYLESRGAIVSVIRLPDKANGNKQGLDDWLAAGHTPAELTGLAVPLAAVAGRLSLAGRYSTTQDYLDALAHLGYSFRLNECGYAVEVNGIELTDGMAAKIRNQMRDAGFSRRNEVEDAYLADAWERRYHPLRAYLDNLTWDGKPHIATLANYVEDKHETVALNGEQVSLFHLYMRRWMIGAVAKVYDQQQNMMLVLDGEQDIGKSFLAAWLCSGLPAYFLEGEIDPYDKDCQLRLTKALVWEVGELGATTRKADVEALKRFITTREITARPAYGRYDVRRWATASLIGTVNNDAGFLNDPTGSRRFMAVTLSALDWDYTKLDPNQLWAEAVAAYRNGEPWRLEEAEKDVQRVTNKRYEMDDPIEEAILKYCTITHDPADDTLGADLFELVQARRRGMTARALQMAIATATKQLGIESERRYIGGVQQRCYVGLKINPVDDTL